MALGVRQALVDLTPLRVSPLFRRLLIGQTLSGLGSQMTVVAVMYQVWQLTNSTIWTGLVGLAHALPIIVFGLFAGSIVDRVDRRRFYLLTTTGQAVCSVLLAAQGFWGHSAVLPLAIVAVQSCFVAGGGPAARTFIPRLLPPGQLAAGLALRQISLQANLLLGPALAGLILGWLGVSGCYLIDVFTFMLAFYGGLGLPSMRPDGGHARPGVRGVYDGLAFLTRNSLLRGALLTDLTAMVLSMPVSVFPAINAERFGGSPRTFGLFLSAIAVGGVCASLLSGVFTRAARTGLVMIVASASWGVALALFALAPNPWLGLGFLVFAGAADTVSVVSRGTVVQGHTPDALRGRVAATEQIVGQAGPDLGNMRAGLVAHATSGVFSLVSGGVLCVVAVVAVALTTPSLRRLSSVPDER